MLDLLTIWPPAIFELQQDSKKFHFSTFTGLNFLNKPRTCSRSVYVRENQNGGKTVEFFSIVSSRLVPTADIIVCRFHLLILTLTWIQWLKKHQRQFQFFCVNLSTTCAIFVSSYNSYKTFQKEINYIYKFLHISWKYIDSLGVSQLQFRRWQSSTQLI